MKLEVLIGMIASGKSTYARKRAQEGALVVCHDDLAAMLHAEYRYEQELRSVYRHMEEALVFEAIGAIRDTVVDRTHLTRESRQRWFDWRRNESLTFRSVLVAVTFPIHAPSIHAERRMATDARGRPYSEWLMVAEHHYAQAQAEPLDWHAEGFDGLIEIGKE